MAMGKNIHHLRRVRGWSHDTLGQMAGTSGQTILQLEKRDSEKSRYATRIADAFGMPLDWLQDLPITGVDDAASVLDLFDRINVTGRESELEDLGRWAEAEAEDMYEAQVKKGALPADDSAARTVYLERVLTPLRQKLRERGRDLMEERLAKTPSAGGPGSAQSAAVSRANVAPAVPGTRRVPVLSYVQAGAMTETGCVDLSQVYDDYITTDLDLSDQAFALEIKGDSMVAPPGSGEESFNEGDRIIVDCTVTPLPGDFVVARNGEHEATFKKYRPRGVDEQGREVFELVPLNPDYPTIRSDRRHVQLIGVMVEHRRYRRKR